MARKIIIFGNSGSGKSSLAKQISSTEKLPHFDLDTIAWASKDMPPKRSEFDDATASIQTFVRANPNGWVIEGAYGDYMEYLSPFATELYYLDLPVEQCLEHAATRPWEPHKYESKAAQDAQLEMLVGWIRSYPKRSDEMSAAAHTSVFTAFDGIKTRITDRGDVPTGHR